MWDYQKNSTNGFFKILDDDVVELIVQKINKYWGTEEIFPAPQPISIERRNFETLQKNDYVVCAKLDGERYLMYLINLPDGTGKTANFTIMINRRLECFLISQNFAKEAYTKGSLFDGELVNNEFVIHDTIAIEGVVYKNEPWQVRWEACNKFLMEKYYREQQNFPVKLKEFFYLNQIEDLFKKIDHAGIKSDGIVFYPMKDPIGSRTQNNLFKWKPPGKHTIDFKIKVKEPWVMLITWGNKQEIEFDKVEIKKFKDFYPEDNQVVEFIGKKGNFKPLRLRADKEVGNKLYTVRKTLLNVEENITAEELIAFF